MKFSRELPDHFHDLVDAMPEHSYGVVRVRLKLEDGSQIDDVYVGWGKEIVRIGESTEVHFDPSLIIAIERC